MTETRCDVLMSVLAGYIFLSARLGMKILTLKALYYNISACNVRNSWVAWRKRGQTTRERGIETTEA
jgi:hypothetical protein